MSIPPSKRHGIFCRFRSAFVRCTARSTGPNRRMASSNISAARTDTAQHAWPTRIQGALPDTAPPSVRDKSLPEIPWTRGSVEVAAPLTLQDGMQSFAQDDPKQKNSIPFPTMQAEPSSPTVTRLSLAEGLGEFNLPSHILTGLAAHVDYDSALSASPPASPPSPDAHAIGDASSPPATFRRTLAHKDGRKPLRPASSDDLDDPAPAFLDNNLENDRQHDSRPTSDFASPEAQPGTPEDQSAAQVADMPGNLTRAFVHVGKTPDDRLPGLMLRIVVGSQTAGNPLFDDALANASRACAIYGHELTQLSLTILHIQIDDGRDSLNAVLEYLQEHLRRILSLDLQMRADSDDKAQTSTKELASALTRLRYLRVDGCISGDRLTVFPATNLSELHVMTPSCALDVIKIVTAFPCIDLMEFSSVGLDNLMFPSDARIGPRPSDADYPSIMYMKVDAATLPCIVEHIPRRVQLSVTLGEDSLRRPFHDNAAWSLQFPAPRPSLIFP